jgi:bis(5'-nucleosyl)-tetraphosphatase (symmetrical)
MKNFVVGDIQGCYKGLKGLLKTAHFDPQQDKLWAVGDLVARGPHSLETLQYLRDLGDHFETVLGNHDLHLIAMAHGLHSPKPADKLDKLIKHKSFSTLIDWLMTKPLAIKPVKGTFISHAGLYPLWSLKQGIALSTEVQIALQASPTKFLKTMYGNTPSTWDEKLSDDKRLRFVVNAFTRMRYLDGLSLEFKTKNSPDLAPSHLQPWYVPNNTNIKPKTRLIFGHWASLLGNTGKKNVIGLDTGYVWGKEMTLYQIENNQFFSYSA